MDQGRDRSKSVSVSGLSHLRPAELGKGACEERFTQGSAMKLAFHASLDLSSFARLRARRRSRTMLCGPPSTYGLPRRSRLAITETVKAKDRW